jgi:hypothetical protein
VPLFLWSNFSPQKLEKNSKSLMLTTDGKAANGFENKIRWSFFNPLATFFQKLFLAPA